MSSYQTLLSIAVEHSYHRDGVCRCLKYKPTQRTQAVFDNAGLLCRVSNKGIQILYDKSRLEALQMFAQDAEDPLSFDFKVYSLDPEFRSYTEPFGLDTPGILYFDNRATAGSGKQGLAATKYVSVEDFMPADSELLSPLLNPMDRIMPPVFMLRIFADNKRGPLLERWLDSAPTVYSIDFISRERFWKYYLLGRILGKIKADADFFVVDPDNRIEFESLGEEQLSDSTRAFAFRSKQPIPLNEYYPFRFQLKQKGQGSEAVVIPSLPVASVNQVGTNTGAEQATVVSEIYINS